MREQQLYSAVDKLLPKGLHTQSMTGLSTTGTLDRYYDGPLGDFWIEWKQLKAWPRRGAFNVMPIPLAKKQPDGHLTDKQLRWLERRYGFGRNAAVIIGMPDKTAVILDTPRLWRFDFDCHLDCRRNLTRKEIAEWIMRKVWVKD
jgi:hypothetical protein